MNLDELRAVQNKERQKDSLQHLRESFYADVADYVEGLREERDAAADAAEDPFADPQVRQLTDEIETATDVAEAVYERRLGKLVKRASLAAADMPADDEGLTAEERALFEDLVDRITENKDRVLDVVEGDADPLAADDADPLAADDADPAPAGADRAGEPADAADAMGVAETRNGAAESPPDDAATPAETETRDGPAGGSGDPTPTPTGDGDGADDRAAPSAPNGPTDAGAATPGTSDAPDAPETSDAPDAPGESADGGAGGLDDRTTVRITDDVGAILGVDQREYDLGESDVVTLPAENAAPLLERDAAERVDRAPDGG